MSIRIRIKKSLEEESGVTGGGLAGHVDQSSAMKKRKDEEQYLQEMYSSQGIRGGTRLAQTNRNADEVHRIAMNAKGLKAHLEEQEQDSIDKLTDQSRKIKLKILRKQ